MSLMRGCHSYKVTLLGGWTLYHHFHDKVQDKTTSILAVAAADRVADYLTKSLPRDSFQKHQNLLQIWGHAVFKASRRMRECENMGFDLIAFLHHAWTNYCLPTRDRLRMPHQNPVPFRKAWDHLILFRSLPTFSSRCRFFSLDRSMISISMLSVFSEATAKISLYTLTFMESMKLFRSVLSNG